MINAMPENVKQPSVTNIGENLLHTSFSSYSSSGVETVKLLLLTEFIIILFRASFLYFKIIFLIQFNKKYYFTKQNLTIYNYLYV